MNTGCRDDRRHIRLIALLKEEPETARFAPMLNRNVGALKLSTANHVEAAIVVDANDDPVTSERLDAIIELFSIELVAVSAKRSSLAREAYRTSGKGRHPAKLNVGDCFSYALATETGGPLLFKGIEFSQTDVIDAASPHGERQATARLRHLAGGRSILEVSGQRCRASAWTAASTYGDAKTRGAEPWRLSLVHRPWMDRFVRRGRGLLSYRVLFR